MKEICGDVSKTNRLTIGQKFMYFMHNLGRGVWGSCTWLQSRGFTITVQKSQTNESPMRIGIDQIFAYAIKKYVSKDTISVFDIGAGSAYFRNQLALAGKKGTYTGLDVYTHRDYMADAVPAFASSLIISKIEDYTLTDTYDVVMSITALEHIADDVKAIEISTASTKPDGVQIHIMPAFLGLFLYLWHGYRQYSPRMVKTLFPHRTAVYRIGGLGSFLVHFICITLPERIIGLPSIRRFAFYTTLLKLGFFVDRILPIGALAYLVVISPTHHE